MRFQGFARPLRCEAFSVIPKRASLALYGAQKNYLWQLREDAAGLVRPQSSSDSGFVVRRYAGVPGIGSSPGALSKLWQSEARGAGVFGGQSVLHQALCFLCGATVSHGDHQGCGQGTQAGLAHGPVKELDKQYMKAQLAKAGNPKPKVIGIDEISIRKGHTYRIVVSDLEKARPIWFGGTDRSEQSMRQFFDELGKPKSTRIRLAVMDMWKPFRNATEAFAPQAAILYDKFHVMRHLGEALDQVRKSEYGRLAHKDRGYIKGQKYTLLSRRDNLTLKGRQALKALLRANKRLNSAYLLKESFGQLWSYEREGWARRFFENWKAALKWQRLRPYEKFAEMIERHWDGVAAYSRPENKVSLGFVEGLNNKIRVIQRRAYGLRDEEYLRLKILTSMLPEL
jgi:transposase